VHSDADGQVDTDKVEATEGAFAVASGSPGHAHVYVRLSESISCAGHDALGKALGAYAVGADADCKFSDNDLLRPPGTRVRVDALRRATVGGGTRIHCR
jgi:hypothetical protein